jgi:hypothetical protein
LGARRAISAVTATREAVSGSPASPVDGGRVTVQVDLGGIWLGIATDGTIQTPEKQPLVLKLPATGTQPTLLPTVTTEKIKLTAVSDDGGTVNPTGRVTLSGLTISTVPTNVSVRLEQMPPFWTRLGGLTAAETSPDFANILNAFLVNAKAQDGFYAIPFTFHSDAIAQMDITLQIDYAIVQPVLPPHLPEVSISYGFSTLPDLASSLTTITLPRNAIPIVGQTGATIRGTFPPTRIAWGQIGSDSQTIPVLVSPECSLAQPFQADREIALTAIDLPLANTEVGLAGLNVSIQADAGGKPFGEVLTSAEVRVEKPLPDQSSWGNATLPAPFRIEKDRRYWLILQSQSGQAYWNATPEATEETVLHSSRDGGFSWRPATVLESPAPPAALFRLRETPEQFRIPVQLQIGEGAGATRRRLDEFAPLGRVEFNFDFAEKLGEYLAAPAMASPCGTDELLTNGSFDQPAHSDATRRLFGFDVGIGYRSVQDDSKKVLKSLEDLSRGVDLSVERFINLYLNQQEVPNTQQATNTIDCAGKNPSRTQSDEIVNAINAAMGQQIAKYESNRLILEVSDQNRIALLPWLQDAVPQRWEGSTASEGEIWRVKLPTLAFESKYDISEAKRLEKQVIEIDWYYGTATPWEEKGIPPAELIVVALKSAGNQPTNLSQTVPVSAGCSYQLNFFFLPIAVTLFDSWFLGKEQSASDSRTEETEKPAVPSWEIRWLNASGELISRKGSELSNPSQFFQDEGNETKNVPKLEGFETKLVAPPDAVQAQIQFIQPPSGVLVLEDVSFKPTLQTLSNANFRFWKNQPLSQQNLEQVNREPVQIPLVWTVVKGIVDRLDTPESTGVLLKGEGPEDAILAQKVAIAGGKQYGLQICAYPQNSGNSQTQQPQKGARLELHWLSNGPIAAPIILLLDGTSFSKRAWTGTAPDEATEAEIRLIQPKGQGNLVVELVSFLLVDSVSVPLIFLAETPGELTVSDLRVAYDLPELPAASPVPRKSNSTNLQRQALTRLSWQLASKQAADADIESPEKLRPEMLEETKKSQRGDSVETGAKVSNRSLSKIALFSLLLSIWVVGLLLLGHLQFISKAVLDWL